ncbi:hypothetical protein BG000_010312 [Podila horticola]|nr:hypothetical protein BG000_010312 [Podila horticola]
MKMILALAAIVLSAPALVSALCVNRDFGYGSFAQPCDCPAGYTIFESSNCSDQSAHVSSGGWTTNQGNWVVKSYECDAVSYSSQCVNQNFGYGTFQKPCDCPGGYTIYQNTDCGGNTAHFNEGGWQTGNNNWPVKAYKCDQVEVAGRCINRMFGKGSFSKPANCPVGYTIYRDAGCGGPNVHVKEGGWTTGDNNWNVQSYKCDAVQILANRCTNRRYDVSTFAKPRECATTGYTIYQNTDCTGAMVHLQDGWTTKDGDWPVQSFRCDDGCSCQPRTSLAALFEPDYFERVRCHDDMEHEQEGKKKEERMRFRYQLMV